MNTDLPGDDVATLVRQQLDERQWNRAINEGWPPPRDRPDTGRPATAVPARADANGATVVDMAAWRGARRRPGSGPA